MKRLFCISLLFVSALTAQASDLSYQAGLKYSFFSYSDPDLNADLNSAFVPSVELEYKLSGRGKKASFEFDYVLTDSDASDSKIGQNAKGYGLTGFYSQRLNISRDFQDFWGSVGLKYSNLDLSERHTADSSGFLKERYANKSISTTALALRANKLFYIDSRKKHSIETRIFYNYAFAGVTEYGFSTSYKF